MKKVLPACALLLVSACAWTPESVAVRREAVPVAAVPGATAVSVAVTAADARQEREISHKKNGYGMRGADIGAANDVVAEVRAGVTDILAGQGFREGDQANVRVELSRFYNTFDMGFWSATASAQATANLQVVSRDGRNLYSRVYSSSHQLPGVYLMNPDNAGNALRPALQGLLRQIADDPQLTRALLQAQPGPVAAMSDAGGLDRLGRGRPGG